MGSCKMIDVMEEFSIIAKAWFDRDSYSSVMNT